MAGSQAELEREEGVEPDVPGGAPASEAGNDASVRLEITRRAHEIWESRGGGESSCEQALADWLRAEQEVLRG